MLRSLLVGVNGSRYSQAALNIAVSWGSQLKIPVTCLGVVDPAALAPVEPVPIGATAYKIARDIRVSARGRDQIEDALKHATEACERSGVECRMVVQQGNPAKLIGEEAQRHDLVIVGRRAIPESDRDPPVSETFLEIVRHAPRPVIVACKEIPTSSDVVIAYDGSVQAARTLQSFVSSGLYYGHPLHLVGISNDANSMQVILRRAVDYLAAHSLKAEMHVLPVAGSVAESLTGFVRRMPTGLMVIGAYGQPWYRELLFGSVTKAVLAGVPVPLFLNH